MLRSLTLGLFLSLLLGWAGYARHALSESGALGAVLVGTTLFAFGGWRWGAVLVAFFVAASGLSFFRAEQKRDVAHHFDKTARRDWGQVLANGGLGALIALLHTLLPGEWAWVAFVGAMAAVNADTWATEVGVLSGQTPRLITTGQPVPRGTSGGVTVAGVLAALMGGLFIGGVGWGVMALPAPDSAPAVGFSLGGALLLGGGAGLLGALFDSWLGARAQVMYRCPVCLQETEQQTHSPCDDAPAQRVRGIRWMNNDAVNFLASLTGAAAGMFIGGGVSLFTFF